MMTSFPIPFHFSDIFIEAVYVGLVKSLILIHDASRTSMKAAIFRKTFESLILAELEDIQPHFL